MWDQVDSVAASHVPLEEVFHDTIASSAALDRAEAAGSGRRSCTRFQSAGQRGALAARHAGQPSAPPVDSRVNGLLASMTLQEKLQQLQLLPDFTVTDQVRNGLGSVLSVTSGEINRLQHLAVEQSRLHIPILFAFDTIHGFRTIFPIPLGTASSFDPQMACRRHDRRPRVGRGRPQADLQPDGRRLPRAAVGSHREGNGEDPYLGSVFAAARVKADTGHDYSAPDKVVTSPKHYAAYGQPEGGRDYNTTDVSEQRLRNLYLPPFKAAIDAGADTAMCSFNAISGVPGCANHETETEILKGEWGFDGFIESDYTAVAELRTCPPVYPTPAPAGTASPPTARRPPRP